MTNKMLYKRQYKQVERDLKYYIENYDMDENEAYEYLNEIYKIRYDITARRVEIQRKDAKLSDENPFA